MGQNISFQTFQVINNIHITLASGILGLTLLLRTGLHNHTVKSAIVGGLTLAALSFAFKSEKVHISNKKVIFITGCDSGLGFSLAVHARSLGFTVIAGCLNLESDGAKELLRSFEDIHVIELDITVQEHIGKTVQYLEDFFLNRSDNGK